MSKPRRNLDQAPKEIGLQHKNFSNFDDRAAEFQQKTTFMQNGLVRIPTQYAEVPPTQRTRAVNPITGSTHNVSNFASEDFLSLATHPGSKQAGIDAYNEFGTHSGGSPLFFGLNSYSIQFSETMRSMFERVFGKEGQFGFYSTEFLARYGVMRALSIGSDNVVMDEHAHRAIKDGINGARTKGEVLTAKHNDLGDLRAKVQRLRKDHPESGIAVVLNDFYRTDGSYSDLEAIGDIVLENKAQLILDCCDSLFLTGAHGMSRIIPVADKIKERLFVIGAGSKALGCNFGFLAQSVPLFDQFVLYLSPSLTFSNAIPPSTASIANYNALLINGPDGDNRRKLALENAVTLRKGLSAAGFEVLGKQPHPIVVVKVGCRLLARTITNLLSTEGVVACFSEYPEVARGEATIRFNVQAFHSQADLKAAVTALKVVVPKAKQYLEANPEGQLAVSQLRSAEQKL